VAATEKAGLGGRLLRALRGLWRSVLGGAFVGGVASGAASGATLPEDKAELMIHSYDGGGVRATGPALLVRKSMADRVSLSGQYYVDAVSNASIDVVTTASPFKETRKAWELGATSVVRDSTLSLSVSRSSEPDYIADGVNVDVAHEVFSGMTTVSLGFGRGHDQVGKKGVGFFDQALHWQYRAGVTQILSTRWLVSLNAEAVADSGFLGSPYRAARAFGAAVPERNPRTRSSRALQLRTAYDTGDWLPRSSLHASWRSYWDNWDIRAGTAELGFSKVLGANGPGGFVLDGTVRLYTQTKALFYSDDATAESQYISRNRQLGTFNDTTLGAKLSYDWPRMPAGTTLKVTGAFQRISFRHKDFTDLRTGNLYTYDANVLQAYLSATF
jgi:hypothetical protein